jgi:uncharacterized protein YdhG (YjbR/CyaY superfamily)
MSTAAAPDVDDYIARAPAQSRPILEALRRIIRDAAPDADERLSYGMPSYHLNGRLVYFALHTHHVGVYPASREDAEVTGLTSQFGSNATLRFRLDQRLPEAAIKKFVERRVRAQRALTPRAAGKR